MENRRGRGGDGSHAGIAWDYLCTEMPTREYYSAPISVFLNAAPDEILGVLARNNDFDLGQTQRDAWLEEIAILQKALPGYHGSVYFEYSIPRMGNA